MDKILYRNEISQNNGYFKTLDIKLWRKIRNCKKEMSNDRLDEFLIEN